MNHEPTVKRWTAKRKAVVVMDIFKGKATVAKVALEYDLTVSEVKSWIEEAQRNMENGSKPALGVFSSSTSPNCGNQRSIVRGPSADLCLKKVQAPIRRE